MKFVYIILFLLISKIGFCQKLPEDLSKRPDGITIVHFDFYKNKKEEKEVFLGKNQQFRFEDKKTYRRIDISQKETDIGVINHYLTFEFLEKLQNCCTEKNCPDTVAGYFLLLKKGAKIEFITIDNYFITPDACGNDELEKIITSFKNL